MKYILALDQGTTSSRAILFDKERNTVAKTQKEFSQIFPEAGWVEHNPMEIWESQFYVAQQLLSENDIDPEDIAAIGITNQRETTVIWNKSTGEPLYNAIVWQDKRTADLISELKKEGLSSYIKETTGLIADAYFSGSKIHWILNNVPGAQQAAENGELAFGTIDTWLLWKLTEGAQHATDYSNASRTMIYNIHELKWDEEILTRLDIPKSILPEVKNSSGDFGSTTLFGSEIKICGIAGDQQAALFGQSCWNAGEAKNTYGTGCFMLMNTGSKCILSESGLISTIAWGINGHVEYALEGSVFIAGAAIQWLRDELKIVQDAESTEEIALSVEDTDGVFVVPAFAGLGAPYWDAYARGAILGLTRGSSRAHIIRATLESLAYQSADVLQAMEKDSGQKLKALKVDGGASKNNFLMQFQADILDTKVRRPENIESTALGAALLAGMAIDYYDRGEITQNSVGYWRDFESSKENEWRSEKLASWKVAVKRVMSDE